MTASTPSDVQAAIDVAYAAATPKRLIEGLPFFHVIAPAGSMPTLIEVDEHKHAPYPPRKKGTYHPATVESFIEIVNRHIAVEEPETTVWVHPTEGRIVAIFNDASGGGTAGGWRDHRAELALTHTREWKHWTDKDGRLMSQLEFAEHIEDGLPELVEPAGADMLELAQSMHATTDAQFRSAVRLQSGQVQTQYDEQIDASAGKSGQMQIPSEFTLAIAPFLGEDPYRITARLRYRLQAGKLTLGYRLERPENVVRDALKSIADALEKKYPAVYLGQPA